MGGCGTEGEGCLFGFFPLAQRYSPGNRRHRGWAARIGSNFNVGLNVDFAATRGRINRFSRGMVTVAYLKTLFPAQTMGKNNEN